MRFWKDWIDVPWWFAWLVWTFLLAWPLLPVALLFEALLHTGDKIGALSWLVSSILVGLISSSIARYLHDRRK